MRGEVKGDENMKGKVKRMKNLQWHPSRNKAHKEEWAQQDN